MATLGMTEQKPLETENDQQQTAADAPKRRAPQRVDAQHALPSDRFAFTKHFPLLQNAAARSGFGAKPIDSDAMEEGVGKQAGQLNAAFFVDIGLMDKKGRQYLPKEPTLKFAKLFTIDQDRARDVLRPVIEATWFAETVRNVLSIKQAASEETLMKELAIGCEVSNYAAKESSFRVLLQYLEWTSILKRSEDGMYTVGVPPAQSPMPAAAAVDSVASVVAPQPGPSGPRDAETSGSAPAVPPRSGPVVSVAMPDGWVHKSWPGLYQVSFKPDLKALKMLKRVIEDLEIVLEDDASQNAPNS